MKYLRKCINENCNKALFQQSARNKADPGAVVGLR